MCLDRDTLVKVKCTMHQDLAEYLEENVSINAIIIDVSKAFDFVPHDRLRMKLASPGVDSRVVFWVKEFLVGRTHRVKIGGQLSMEVQVTPGVPQGRAFCPLLFLLYVNDIWRNVNSSIRLFADDCIIYRKMTH